MIKPDFLLASLIVVLIPGTGVVYTITTGLTLKWQASLAAAIGCTLGMVLLSLVFMGITLIVFALYGLLASGVSAYLANSTRAVKRLQQAFAVILAGFAIKLAITEK